jgi:hypothetical protein
MKVGVLILVALFAFGLIVCRNQREVEVEKIVEEWIGKTIKFPDIESVILYFADKYAGKYAVTDDGHTKFKTAHNIWWLGKNNLDRFGGLPVASDTDKFSLATQVVVSKTEAVRITCSDFFDRFE